MLFSKKEKPTAKKQAIINTSSKHLSSEKVRFFKKYGMDFVMGQRQDSCLYDMDESKQLINLHCNGGVFNLGHKNRELTELLKKALDDYDIGNHHLMSIVRAELAEQIATLMPGDLEYTVFGVGGGEAIDLSFKVARAFTKKTKIISAKGGYHGHTGLAIAAGDERYRERFGPQAPGFVQVPFGNIEAIVKEIDSDTAAVILETIPATLGIVIPKKAYLQSLKSECEKQNVLLILDEVQTGLGRTGKLWAFEHYNIVPDIVVLGKGLSGGIYPITATVLKKEIESVFHPDPFVHISTFGGAELGCVIAGRVLEISSDPKFLEHVNTLAQLFAEGIKPLIKQHKPYLKGLRQSGLMMGLQLADELSGPILTKTAYDNGLLLIYANNDPSVCQFLPPLTMEIDDVEIIFKKLDKAFTAAKRLKPLVNLKEKIKGFF